MIATDDKAVRRKLVDQGAAALSDAELISVVIGEGAAASSSVSSVISSSASSTAPQSAVTFAENLLAATEGGLATLARADVRQLRMAGGLGVKRAAMLAAAFELARRMQRCGETKMSASAKIASNEDVVRRFRPRIAHLPHEEFWVLYLNAANSVVGEARVSQGGVSSTVVDHRLIVKRAVELLASGIILVHNHPSGVAVPSVDDEALTRRIVEAASLFDIAVLDHLIITAGDCLSFRREGLIG